MAANCIRISASAVVAARVTDVREFWARAPVVTNEPISNLADADRKAVMLRPDLDRYAAWERAAGKRAVSTWLGDLADAASGWKR
jgi:hypothetical protein